MEKKRLLSIFFLSLIITSLILPAAFVSAADPATPAKTPKPNAFGATCSGSADSGFFESMYCTWLGGITGVSKFELMGEYIKWLFLGLVIMLIYSSLTYAKFPEGSGARVLISIIVGFLATMLITTEELLAAMQSYTAMGMALTIFFPIMVLAFFTMVVVTKAAPFGIFLQRILWLVYSLYLFFKTFTMWILTKCDHSIFYNTPTPYNTNACGNTLLNFLAKYIVAPFNSTSSIESAWALAQNSDTTTLVILLISSIFVFFIAVLGNKWATAWMQHEKINAEYEARKAQLEREDMRMGLSSKSMQGDLAKGK